MNGDGCRRQAGRSMRTVVANDDAPSVRNRHDRRGYYEVLMWKVGERRLPSASDEVVRVAQKAIDNTQRGRRSCALYHSAGTELLRRTRDDGG
jgi:dihydroxyacetone kinase